MLCDKPLVDILKLCFVEYLTNFDNKIVSFSLFCRDFTASGFLTVVIS